MSKVVLYMSMSLDGFITGPDDRMDHGLGVNGERLHDWLHAGGVDPASHRPVDGPSAAIFDELMATVQVVHVRNRTATVKVMGVSSPDIPPGTAVRQVARFNR